MFLLKYGLSSSLCALSWLQWTLGWTLGMRWSGYTLDGAAVYCRPLGTHKQTARLHNFPTKQCNKTRLCILFWLLFHFITTIPFTDWCYAILASVQMQAIIRGWCQGGAGNANHYWNQCMVLGSHKHKQLKCWSKTRWTNRAFQMVVQHFHQHARATKPQLA